MPPWPLWRMLSPISSAVICSRMRGILEFAAIDGAQPGNLGGQLADELRGSGIIAADDDITLDRTVAVQHLGRAVMKRSTTVTPLGTSSAVCCAAEPCHTPSVRWARPPTPEAKGTVASIRTLPDLNAGFQLLQQSGLTFEGYGQRQQISAAQATEFSSPVIFACRHSLFDLRRCFPGSLSAP